MLQFLRFSLFALCITILPTSCKTFSEDLSDKKKANKILLLKQLAKDAELTFEYKNAATYYETLYQLEPKNLRNFKSLVKNLRYIGASKEAIRWLKKYKLTNNLDTELLLELSKSQYASQMIKEAEQTLSLLEPTGNTLWQFHTLKAMILDYKNNYFDAQKSYKIALTLSPNNTSILNNLSLSLAQQGKIRQAIDILTKINKSEKSTLQTRQNLALLYGLVGHKGESKRLMEKDLPTSFTDFNSNLIEKYHKGSN